METKSFCPKTDYVLPNGAIILHRHYNTEYQEWVYMAYWSPSYHKYVTWKGPSHDPGGRVNLHEAVTALVAYAFQSGLLLIVGLLLPRVLNLRHPRTLLAYWRILLAVAILLPLLPLNWPRQPPLPILKLDGKLRRHFALGVEMLFLGSRKAAQMNNQSK